MAYAVSALATLGIVKSNPRIPWRRSPSRLSLVRGGGVALLTQLGAATSHSPTFPRFDRVGVEDSAISPLKIGSEGRRLPNKLRLFVHA